jgi:phosphoadenosine phosphosulfate reductase
MTKLVGYADRGLRRPTVSTVIGRSSGANAPSDAERDALIEEMNAASEQFEGADPGDVIAWATTRFGNDIVLADSFQDAVLLDFASKRAPAIEVLFLDTGYHFPETLAYMRKLEEELGLNLTVVEPDVALDQDPCGSANCCAVRKVAPLNKVLATKAAWITGLKRVDTPDRADAPTVAYDPAKGVVKINPLVAWTDDAIDEYVAANELRRHSLNYVGYISIGCAPTTRPVAPGEDPRAGRWSDSDKTECGLHI